MAMAITGIPNYDGSLPVEYSIRCLCSRRFLVFTGAKIVGDAEGRAKERAGQLNATFVDLRQTPFMSCDCGEVIDFTVTDEAVTVM